MPASKGEGDKEADDDEDDKLEVVVRVELRLVEEAPSSLFLEHWADKLDAFRLAAEDEVLRLLVVVAKRVFKFRRRLKQSSRRTSSNCEQHLPAEGLLDSKLAGTSVQRWHSMSVPVRQMRIRVLKTILICRQFSKILIYKQFSYKTYSITKCTG